MSGVARHGNVLKGDVMRCSESTSERSYAGWQLLLKGERRASVPGLSVWLMKKWPRIEPQISIEAIF